MKKLFDEKDDDMYKTFRFDDQAMDALRISKIELDEENGDELWRYVIFDKNYKTTMQKKYFISNYGRIYDICNHKLKKQSDNASTSVGKYKSISITTAHGRSKSYLVHRLVALTFIPIDEDRPLVNHKDGNPANNKLSNLEWCTLSENVLHAVKMGLKVDKKGEERSNALWTDDEIRMICKMMEEGHKATYIYTILCEILKDPKVQYERVRTLYKHIIRQTHWTHISKDYDIDFTRYNYAKESASVKKKQKKVS